MSVGEHSFIHSTNTHAMCCCVLQIESSQSRQEPWTPGLYSLGEETRNAKLSERINGISTNYQVVKSRKKVREMEMQQWLGTIKRWWEKACWRWALSWDLIRQKEQEAVKTKESSILVEASDRNMRHIPGSEKKASGLNYSKGRERDIPLWTRMASWMDCRQWSVSLPISQLIRSKYVR